MFLVLLLAAVSHSARGDTAFVIDLGKLNRSTDPTHFVSFTHDSFFVVAEVHQPAWQNQRLQTMVSALAPAYLRIGGSDMDFTTFNFSQDHFADGLPLDTGKLGIEYDEPCGQHHPNPCTINPAVWAPFAQFAKKVGLELVVGMNALVGRGMGFPEDTPWNSSDAHAFINWTQRHFPGVIVGYELGNEPDDFTSNGTSVDWTQLAKDFATLRKILDELSPSAFLWGPDVSWNDRMFRGVLQAMEPHVLTGATYHQYYDQNGGSASLSNYTDVWTLDSIVPKMQDFGEITREVGNGTLQFILGETGSFSGGGHGSPSDTFAGVFLWLDKLGMAAVLGHHVVAHQCLLDPVLDAKGGDEVSYEIIKEGIFDNTTGGYRNLAGHYTPRPNYWASLLHKALVGPGVLTVQNVTHSGRAVRLYAHCAARRGASNASHLLKADYQPGAVTVFVVNTLNASQTVEIASLCPGGSCLRDEYHFESAGDLVSVLAKLNGATLSLDADGHLPQLIPRTTQDKPIRVAPSSISFVVFPAAKAKACAAQPVGLYV